MYRLPTLTSATVLKPRAKAACALLARAEVPVTSSEHNGALRETHSNSATAIHRWQSGSYVWKRSCVQQEKKYKKPNREGRGRDPSADMKAKQLQLDASGRGTQPGTGSRVDQGRRTVEQA